MIGSALKALLPLIIFVGGMIVLFLLNIKAKWFVTIAVIVLTAVLLISPLGPPIIRWAENVIKVAFGGHA